MGNPSGPVSEMVSLIHETAFSKKISESMTLRANTVTSSKLCRRKDHFGIFVFNFPAGVTWKPLFGNRAVSREREKREKETEK